MSQAYLNMLFQASREEPKERLELLEVSLLDRLRPLAEEFRALTLELGLNIGWHYLLDQAWLADRLGEVRGKTILDAGAGMGTMQWWLADRGARVISVDLLPRKRVPEHFYRRYRVDGWTTADVPETLPKPYPALSSGGEVLLHTADLARMPDIPDESMDAVVSISSLEHNELDRIPAVAAELERVLKPGGRMLITLSATGGADFYHQPSQGWVLSEATLRRVFGLDGFISNFNRFDKIFANLKNNRELKESLSPFYFKSGDNGMPWGRWDPQYMPVGIEKVRLLPKENHALTALHLEGGREKGRKGAREAATAVRVNLIDVGSAGGLPEPWNAHPEAIGKRLTFEPRERADANPNVISVSAALWDRAGERNFYIYRGFNGTGSSLFLQNYDYVLQNFEQLKTRGPAGLAQTWLERSLLTDMERVKTTTLDEVLRGLEGREPFHFLKIDAQGAEYQILCGAENYLRNECCGLQLELFTLPLYKGIKLLDEVVAFLDGLGFELVKKFPSHGSFDSQHECVFLKRGVGDEVMSAIRRVYNLPGSRPTQIDRSTIRNNGTNMNPILPLEHSDSLPSHPLPDIPKSEIRNPRSGIDRERVLNLSQQKLPQFRDIHRGQRCVIVGNGPSLNRMELGWLRDEITFGMNRIFLGLDKFGFQPTYYVAVNPLVLEQSVEGIRSLRCPKFLSVNGLKWVGERSDIYYLLSRPGFSFSIDAARDWIWEGHTVTYAALQLGFYMGFEEVILIGVDHNFPTRGAANKEVVSGGEDPNHFHPDYFGRGMRWNLPDLERSERSYRVAQLVYEGDNRTIIDATDGGRLTVFPKADWRTVAEQGRQRRTQAQELNRSGEEQYRQGKFQEAQQRYSAALRLAPRAADIWNNVGVLQYALGNVPLAGECLARAIEYDPHCRDAYFNVSELFNATGNREGAKKVMESYRTLHPGEVELAGR